MPQGLTDHQQALLVFLAGFLGSIGTFLASSLAQNPALFPAWFAIVPGLIGTSVGFLKEFLGASPAQQQSVIDQFKAAGPALQQFAAMTSDQQKAVLSILVLEAPVPVAKVTG